MLNCTMPFVYKEADGLGFYEVSGWEGARALFTTRKGGVSRPPFDSLNLGSGGGDDSGLVAENRRLLERALGLKAHAIKTVSQVHGAEVYALLDPEAPSPRKGYDAIVSNAAGAALSVLTADCVPILLYDPVSRSAASVHAGWAGTVKGVAGRAVQEMAKVFGARPSDIRAAVGPSIGPCCYEVGEKVVGEFRHAYDNWAEVANPARPGHWLLDLWEANRGTLIAAGLVSGNISVMGLCTACNPDKFFSHRAGNGRAGRMMGVILLREKK
jgi:YfiH family protein